MTLPLFPRLLTPDDHPAVLFEQHTLRYSELSRACAAHVAALARAGLSPGDRVGVWTHPSIETVVALVGNALAGIVSVPLNPSLGDRELIHILQDAAPAAVLVTGESAVVHRTPSCPTLPVTVDLSASPLSSVYDKYVDDQPLLVIYTSGTTGAPKGAVLTARNISANLDALRRAWAWTERDILVHALPLFHVHGLCLGLFGALRTGCTLHWLRKFSPESVATAFLQGATMLFAVPTMYHRLADAMETDSTLARAFWSARLLVSGSAPLPTREHVRLRNATGQRVVERYGLTETLINCAVRHDGDRRAGYVGPALDGVEVRLVDDERKTLPFTDDQTIGEVAVRGPNVFAGYLNRPEATRSVLDDDGWFYTGDLATIAPDGYVRIVGRKSIDLIKTGGFKVGAGEVEAALLEHPSVRECAVIGLPDEDLGEKIVAYVVLRENQPAVEPAALIHHVASLLAPHKRPREVRFVSELPRNAMGKVRKSVLRTLSSQ